MEHHTTTKAGAIAPPSIAIRIAEHLETALQKRNQAERLRGTNNRLEWNRRKERTVIVEHADWGRRTTALEVYVITDESIDLNLHAQDGHIGTLLARWEITAEGTERRQKPLQTLASEMLDFFTA